MIMCYYHKDYSIMFNSNSYTVLTITTITIIIISIRIISLITIIIVMFIIGAVYDRSMISLYNNDISYDRSMITYHYHI